MKTLQILFGSLLLIMLLLVVTFAVTPKKYVMCVGDANGFSYCVAEREARDAEIEAQIQRLMEKHDQNGGLSAEDESRLAIAKFLLRH